MEIQPDIELNSIAIVKSAMEQGLLLVPAGPKVLRLVPPLIVSEAEINQAADILESVIAQLA